MVTLNPPKPGCRDPKLGEAQHRERCTACMLECVAFALDEHAAPPRSGGAKLADAIASVVNQNTMNDLLKIVFGKIQPQRAG